MLDKHVKISYHADMNKLPQEKRVQILNEVLPLVKTILGAK
jgi:hypothetical protein